MTLFSDALQPGAATPPTQRALLIRVLARLARANAPAVEPYAATLRAALRPVLRAEAEAMAAAGSTPDRNDAADLLGGGSGIPASPTAVGSGGGVLPALLTCLPPLWAAEADDEEDADFARIARLVQSDTRETAHAASICLHQLLSLQRRRLTVPVLTAVARMLLCATGSRPTQLLRSLNMAIFLARGAEALVAEVGRPIASNGVATTGPASVPSVDAADSGPLVEAALSEIAAEWNALRVVVQGAAIGWIVHSHPEVAIQAATLLVSFDSEIALQRLPAPPERPPLRTHMSQWWSEAGGAIPSIANPSTGVGAGEGVVAAAVVVAGAQADHGHGELKRPP